VTRGDRHGHAGLLIPGLLIAAAGMASLIWVSAPVVVIAGMCLFGIGFGIAQNTTFALMLDRAPASGYGTASALWNLAYDAGYGTGPIVFGVFVFRIRERFDTVDVSALDRFRGERRDVL